MKKPHRVGGLDAERLAQALASVSDEAGTAPPGQRLLKLAAKLAPEADPPAAQPAAPPRPQPVETQEKSEPPADLLRRTLIEYGEVLKRYRQDFDRLFAEQPATAAGEDETLKRLHQARLLLIKYPVAAQAVFAALVAEGRRYAETPAGQRDKARLATSDLVRKGRAVFEAVSGGMLGEHAGPLPSGFLEAFLDATRREGLEEVLGKLFGGVE